MYLIVDTSPMRWLPDWSFYRLNPLSHLRPEMNRSRLELSIDNLFTKTYWKLNEKNNIEVYRRITTVESIIAFAPYSKARLDLISTLL
jgi:hypothetical protein